MAVDITLTPRPDVAARARDKKQALTDPDFILLTSLTPQQGADWIDANSGADAKTKRLLKVLLKAAVVLARQLEKR